MCAGAIVLARVPRVVYAAAGPQGGRRRERARRARRAAAQPPPRGGRRAARRGRGALLRQLLRVSARLADKRLRAAIFGAGAARDRESLRAPSRGSCLGRIHLRARHRGALPLHQPVREEVLGYPRRPVARGARAVGSHPAPRRRGARRLRTRPSARARARSSSRSTACARPTAATSGSATR